MSILSNLRRRIFILGLCRNGASTLPSLLEMIRNLVHDGRLEVSVFFGENGSTDGTRKLLDIAADDFTWLNIVDTDFMSGIPERLARMAAGREALRLLLPKAVPGDVVLVMDTDIELVRPLSADSIFTAFNELDQPMTTGVCSYSLPVHYDILALRETVDAHSPALDAYVAGLGARDFLSRLRRFPKNILNEIQTYRYQQRLGSSSGKEFFSAFNGLCLYHRNLYDSASYLETGIECEHVTLHRHMHRNAKGSIRVSNTLGVRAPTEHVVTIAGIISKRVMRLGQRNFFKRVNG